MNTHTTGSAHGPSDSLVAGSRLLPERYLMGDFEDSLTERGIRVTAYEIEETECHSWPFDDATEALCPACLGTGKQVGEFLRWADAL